MTFLEWYLQNRSVRIRKRCLYMNVLWLKTITHLTNRNINIFKQNHQEPKETYQHEHFTTIIYAAQFYPN